MIIRRNTKAYKTILGIVSACETRGDRNKLIRLYITKAGHTIHNRLPIEGITGDNEVFYQMNYTAILTSLQSAGRQLHESDEVAGLFFFRSVAGQSWDENPFEFDERIAQEFSTRSHLPITRKKEKPAKIEALPRPKNFTLNRPETQTPKTKDSPTRPRPAPTTTPQHKQPRFKLNHPMRFTDLEKVVICEPSLTKGNVLDYYYKMADFIIPYVKNHALMVKRYNNGWLPKDHINTQSLQHNAQIQFPSWMHTSADKQLLCQQKEDLLFYIEHGAIDMYAAHAGIKSPGSPDYAAIGLSAAGHAFDKVIDVALTTYDILTGLQLPSWVKTDGLSGLHIYIPLDAKSPFESASAVATIVGKLIQLKMPQNVVLTSSQGPTYNKVVVDDLLNAADKNLIIPYSLLPGSATVATPLLWNEITHGLDPRQFTHQNTPNRAKEIGDLFERRTKKRINATLVAKDLIKHYGFLI